ncbi:MAG: 2-C-methyl-D-erythritol 2,4-cyclodiphosphate synthase [Epulopiscium sp.]|nr:2-C-methyl-D-erythritol 2,4-cyclodiphosphate synthase [Candidatus Epulonipiscium sp.]
MRIGMGYDVHRLVKNRPLMIGGVHIPFDKGLLGHSDADVLIHAIMDALLGAAGLGDIGKHFPDTQSEYKDISSIILLAKVKEILKKEHYKIGNIDATIVAQAPKMAPYIEDMKKQISQVLSIDINQINIKATTEEGLGISGTEEGITSYAISLLVNEN